MGLKFLALVVVVHCILSFSEAFTSNQIGKRSKIFKVECSPFVLCGTSCYFVSIMAALSYLDRNNFDIIVSTKYMQNILYVPPIYNIYLKFKIYQLRVRERI